MTENSKVKEVDMDKVYRGGGWNFNDYFCRSVSRDFGHPSCSHLYIGFRIVMGVRQDASKS